MSGFPVPQPASNSTMAPCPGCGQPFSYAYNGRRDPFIAPEGHRVSEDGETAWCPEA